MGKGACSSKVSELVLRLVSAAVCRWPPPSPATISLGEPRVGCALKSATHPWKSHGQSPFHALSRGATVSCQLRRVKATRRPLVAESSPDLF
ncbi:hypothetical protein D0Y65_048064 [Glycine soja]|uniref:Uncharacterized protein n=1 Tax=Glycine soja TaxID=3848 RepID=A0A445FRF6_GLYSO|nr:hypothetical protein D0Y65_048064 [Glycine soja]